MEYYAVFKKNKAVLYTLIWNNLQKILSAEQYA